MCSQARGGRCCLVLAACSPKGLLGVASAGVTAPCPSSLQPGTLDKMTAGDMFSRRCCLVNWRGCEQSTQLLFLQPPVQITGDDNILNCYRKIHKSLSVREPSTLKRCVLSVRARLASANTLLKTTVEAKYNIVNSTLTGYICSAVTIPHAKQRRWEKLGRKNYPGRYCFLLIQSFRRLRNISGYCRITGAECIHSFKE